MKNSIKTALKLWKDGAEESKSRRDALRDALKEERAQVARDAMKADFELNTNGAA